jgi:hypothetical protein
MDFGPLCLDTWGAISNGGGGRSPESLPPYSRGALGIEKTFFFMATLALVVLLA